MELGVDKTLLAKVCKTYSNKVQSNDYSFWISAMDILELKTECEEKARKSKSYLT